MNIKMMISHIKYWGVLPVCIKHTKIMMYKVRNIFVYLSVCINILQKGTYRDHLYDKSKDYYILKNPHVWYKDSK